MTDPRLEWLSARLDEDEATAIKIRDYLAAGPYQPYTTLPLYTRQGNITTIEHVRNCDPARALAVVAAGRQILEEHRPDAEPPYSVSCVTCTDKTGGIWKEQWCDEPWPCPTVRAIASIWADHDGYAEVWGDGGV